MKQLGTVLEFDLPSRSGMIKLEDGNVLNFIQENIGLNIKGQLLVNKSVIVYHEKFRIRNVIPKDHLSYGSEDKVEPNLMYKTDSNETGEGLSNSPNSPTSSYSSNSGNKFLQYLPWGLLLVFFLFDLNFDELKGFLGPTSISEMTCEDVKDQAKSLKPKNAFGREYEILTIKELELKSKNETMIQCIGEITYDDLSKVKSNLKIVKEDGEFKISIEPID